MIFTDNDILLQTLMYLVMVF